MIDRGWAIVATAAALFSLVGCNGEQRGPMLAGGREVKSWLADLHDPKPALGGRPSSSSVMSATRIRPSQMDLPRQSVIPMHLCAVTR